MISPETPFQITLNSDPMTLVPGISKEVTVRFRPTGPGVYTGSLRVVNSSLPVVNWEAVPHQFLGEIRNGAGAGKALRFGLLLDAITDTFLGELLFEPFSSYSLRLTIWRNAKDVVLTFRSSQGDKLQVFMKLLQVPGWVDCPVLLPSDFADQQKVSQAYATASYLAAALTLTPARSSAMTKESLRQCKTCLWFLPQL